MLIVEKPYAIFKFSVFQMTNFPTEGIGKIEVNKSLISIPRLTYELHKQWNSRSKLEMDSVAIFAKELVNRILAICSYSTLEEVQITFDQISMEDISRLVSIGTIHERMFEDYIYSFCKTEYKNEKDILKCIPNHSIIHIQSINKENSNRNIEKWIFLTFNHLSDSWTMALWLSTVLCPCPNIKNCQEFKQGFDT